MTDNGENTMFKKLSPLLLAVSMTCAADQAMIVLDAS